MQKNTFIKSDGISLQTTQPYKPLVEEWSVLSSVSQDRFSTKLLQKIANAMHSIGNGVALVLQAPRYGVQLLHDVAVPGRDCVYKPPHLTRKAMSSGLCVGQIYAADREAVQYTDKAREYRSDIIYEVHHPIVYVGLIAKFLQTGQLKTTDISIKREAERKELHILFQEKKHVLEWPYHDWFLRLLLWKPSFFQSSVKALRVISVDDKSIQVLWARSGAEGKLLPVVTDIDPHNISINTSSERVYSTLQKDEACDMQRNSAHSLERMGLLEPRFEEYLVRQSAPYAGDVALEEWLVLQYINFVCSVSHHSTAEIFHHGSTARVPAEIAEKVRIESLQDKSSSPTEFPKIDHSNDLFLLMIMSAQGELRQFALRGLAILAFYEWANQNGYHFPIHPDWEAQIVDSGDHLSASTEEIDLIMDGMGEASIPVSQVSRKKYNQISSNVTSFFATTGLVSNKTNISPEIELKTIWPDSFVQGITA